ncbi:hypothetical protein AVEN_197676-1 [Araneus ventricosus]|uniref:Uncharacterized protein n=1 Tax=Araneus ventricosus TaxID=182803 RepID=A0A4Y2Q2H9_ARAVE|nr:hypothetical protein AVEN_197676-1 [Araneus ventricosus]
MKYFKKTGQLTPIFKPSQTIWSWFPMPELEFNLSQKLTNQLLNSPLGQAKTNSKYQLIKQILLISKLVRGPTIRWKGKRIKRAHALHALGVYIDEKVNWNTQLKAQSTKATQLYKKSPKNSWEIWRIPLKHRRILCKTVIELVLAHGQ